MSGELTEFLLARIAEDEAGGERIASASCHGVESDAEADYFRFADPGRVLAECKAKRWLIANALERTRILSDGRREPEMIHDLRVLGEVYADHPDYREEWRP